MQSKSLVSKKKKLSDIAKCVRNLLDTLGYDLKNPELSKTPRRVAKLLFEELVKKENIKTILQGSPYPFKSMVILRAHEGWTRCPHHLERVKLTTWIAYIPNGRVIGVSKLARIANYYSKGLMLQEEITDAIAEGLFHGLKPKGVAVTIKGEHMCMRARGVKTTGDVITSSLKGIFMDDPSAKEEFFQIVGQI